MGFILLLGLAGSVLGIIGLIKGSVSRARIANRKVATVVLIVGLVFISVGAAGDANEVDEVTEPEEAERVEDTEEEPQEEPEEEEPEPEPETKNTEIAASYEIDNDTVIIGADTNLPDGTRVWAAVTSAADPDYDTEEGAEVSDGSYSIEIDVSDYPSGDIYIATGFSPHNQPEEAELYEEAYSEAEAYLAPHPKIYEGSGDDYLSIDSPADPFILLVQGNESSRHFAVTGYDVDGNHTELFVNTTEPYHGITLDLDETRQLEIDAHGGWRIELRSLREATTVEVPGRIEGSGDYVFILDGEPSAAEIKGNQQERHFAVLGYGNQRYLLVNTTDAYDGRNRVESDVRIITVTAVGDWGIEIE